MIGDLALAITKEGFNGLFKWAESKGVSAELAIPFIDHAQHQVVESHALFYWVDVDSSDLEVLFVAMKYLELQGNGDQLHAFFVPHEDDTPVLAYGSWVNNPWSLGWMRTITFMGKEDA